MLNYSDDDSTSQPPQIRASSIPIPLSGIDISKQVGYIQLQSGKTTVWYFLYSYGAWQDNFIFFTVSRREIDECNKEYSSPNRTSSSFPLQELLYFCNNQSNLKEQNIIELPSRGEYLAEKFIEILDDYEITSKLFCIITDNAYNMLKMGKEIDNISLKRSDFAFNCAHQMIPCFAHILNITCQDILYKGLKSSAQDTNFNDV
ncbi:hypothetical protein K501DRAFT_279540 [Backusella circina FSU 941]|nr:hypothetical protein K501DRAFT_279540 [Backusella circina FSU 941]